MRSLIPILVVLLMVGACGPGGGGGGTPTTTTNTGSNTGGNTGTSGTETTGGNTGTPGTDTGTGATDTGTTPGSGTGSSNGTTSGGSVIASAAGAISGIVTDSDTAYWGSLTPLANATVKVGSKTFVTGADGVFSITGITPGEVTVTASRSDFEAYSASATVIVDDTVTHNIPLVFTKAIRVVTGRAGVGGVEADFTMLPPNATVAVAPSIIPNLTDADVDVWIAPTLGGWIGPNDENWDSAAGLYKYEYHFQLPDATVATMLSAWNSDNGTVAYLNGAKIVNQPGERATPFTELNGLNIREPTLFKVGDNTLVFEVDNWTRGPTGFYFIALIRY